MARRTSRGFTLIELMVVTTILGMLLSMLFPAVHATRMGMRRIACLNNIRNVAQATLRYVNSSKRNEFPGWRQAHQMPGVRYDESTLSNRLTVLSWGTTLLPYLDRNDLYQQFLLSPFTLPTPKKTAYLDVYVCPSDYPEARFDNPLSYVANCGLPDPLVATQKPFAESQNQRDSVANGVFKDLRPRWPKLPTDSIPDPISELPSESFTTAHFIDGADKTLMFSENLICPHFLGDPNEPEQVVTDVNAPPVEPTANPKSEEDTGAIPFRTWTGLRIAPLTSAADSHFYAYAEDITIRPQAGKGYAIQQSASIGPTIGIQEWLIGMVWFEQPAQNPVAGSGEWSSNLSRINRWPAGAGDLAHLGADGGDTVANPSSYSTSPGAPSNYVKLFLNSRPASNHNAGVNVAFCDGHTGWLRQDIFYWVYMQLMTPDGMHACNHLRNADNPNGPWFIARQFLGTNGQTATTAPLYVLEDRDYK